MSIPSDLLTPEPPFTDDELLASLEALYTAATEPTGDEAEPTEEVETLKAPTRWEISGTRSAEWAMAKFGESRSAAADNSATAEEWRAIIYASVAEHLERIAEWEAEVNKPLEQKAAFFEGHLQRWALANRTKTVKSFKLPSGTVTTTSPSPTFEIAEDAAAVAFARAHDLPVKETTTVTALKAVAKFVEVAARVPFEDSESGWMWLAPDAVQFTWVPDPRPDDAAEWDNETGTWTVVNVESGEVIADAEVHEGPFIVDLATGEPLPFLNPKPPVVKATVTLA